MKILLFIVAAAIVMLVACDVQSKPGGIPSTIHLVENPTYGVPTLYKYHDDTGKVTCYVSWANSGSGISCLRDESK